MVSRVEKCLKVLKLRPIARGKLQFSTSVEPTAQKIVRVCVKVMSYHISRLRIFLIFGQKLDIDKLTKLTEPDFPKKIWIIQKFTKKCHFLRFFDFCWKSKSLIGTFFAENDRTNL